MESFFEFLLILATLAPPPGMELGEQDSRALHLAERAFTALQLNSSQTQGAAHGRVGGKTRPVTRAGPVPAARVLQPLSSSGAATGLRAGLAPPRPFPSSPHHSPPSHPNPGADF